jgi:hypothetical protein
MNRRRTLRFLGLLAVLFFGFIAAYLLVVRPTNVPTLNSSGTAMKFYQVQPRPLWGDYGTILINGMSGHLYWGKMPEAMFGRWIIVTEHGKLWLEENAGEWVRFKPLPVKQ